MKTNVESRVFSITTLSATLPGAKTEVWQSSQERLGVQTNTQAGLLLLLYPNTDHTTRKASAALKKNILLTCANHGDGGLYINPLICIDARVNKDEAIEVGFLYPTQCILNGVIILEGEETLSGKEFKFKIRLQEQAEQMLNLFKAEMSSYKLK